LARATTAHQPELRTSAPAQLLLPPLFARDPFFTAPTARALKLGGGGGGGHDPSAESHVVDEQVLINRHELREGLEHQLEDLMSFWMLSPMDSVIRFRSTGASSLPSHPLAPLPSSARSSSRGSTPLRA